MQAIVAFLLVVAAIVAISLGLGALFALPVYLAWNYLAPVFGMPHLTFLQSWAIMFLFNTLIRGVVTINKSK